MTASSEVGRPFWGGRSVPRMKGFEMPWSHHTRPARLLHFAADGPAPATGMTTLRMGRPDWSRPPSGFRVGDG